MSICMYVICNLVFIIFFIAELGDAFLKISSLEKSISLANKVSVFAIVLFSFLIEMFYAGNVA